jgi:hypothetical protein
MERLFNATGPPSNWVAAVRAHRQAQRQVGHGFLGLPKPNGISQLQSPAKEARSQHAACAQRREACRAFGTATCWSMAWQRTFVCTRRRWLECKGVPPVRSLRQIGRVHASLRGRALQCGCCWVVSHGYQRRRAAWGCTSVATAAASACRGKTSRPIHRTMAWGRVGGRVAGGGLGLRGAVQPARPALSAQARAGRPARRPRRCTCSGRRRTQLRTPSACRARTGSIRFARRHGGTSTARRTDRWGRTRRRP